MNDRQTRALEAAVRALRERNEVLEADRQLLGARVADLETRIVRLQREVDSVSGRERRAGRLRGMSPVRLAKRAVRVLSALVRAPRRRQRRSPAAGAKQTRDATSTGHRAAGHVSACPPDGRSRRLRVLGVLDTMSAECFGRILDLILPSPEEARTLIRDREIDFVLVESAWQGNGGSWQYHVGSYATPGHRGIPALRALVEEANKLDIPTVFWNKEDPVHFGKFAEAARLFDHVFTTDADRIGTYRALKGRARSVEGLQFAAEPTLHNPLGGHERSPTPVFAGTFYQNRHADRQDSLRVLLEAAAQYGLVIYDRMHGSGQPGYDFPESVASCVVGSLPYTELVGEYRRHRVFLNANSVTRSPTMFARRVFELLACGTPVVSTPSRGMLTTFPSLVDPVESAEDAKTALHQLLSDDDYWFSRSRAGIQSVMLNHTYAHRVAQIAHAIGLEEPPAGPSVALVCTTVDEVRAVRPIIEGSRGLSELAIPADVPGEEIRSLKSTTSRIERVVRFGPGSGPGSGALMPAVDRIRSDWVLCASDLADRDASVVTDLAAATVFSPVPYVAARRGERRDSLFTLTEHRKGDVVVQRRDGVAKGNALGTVLLASVE